MGEMRLYDITGNRLYLNAEERATFLDVARKKSPIIRTFAETLHFTGCRISEALEITPKRIELEQGQIVLRSLKKRRGDVFRAVPVPPAFLDTLNTAHSIREAQKQRKKSDARLWPWHRQHAWRVITSIMIEAGISEGVHRTPKGLRHGFGINATVNGVPLNMLQKWMGHAHISTTAIYADAIGQEEQDIAARMWK
ncbi:MAG: site-specific integrase [Rhizobiales bacterium]|nr:site-specific integrase [Hyphomicrobiales bacterium]